MTTTTTNRHHATTRTARAGHPAARPSSPTGPTGPSEAFLAEVRVQWAGTTRQLDDAVARGDEVGQQDATDRLEELRELLWRHDLSLDVLRRGALL